MATKGKAAALAGARGASEVCRGVDAHHYIAADNLGDFAAAIAAAGLGSPSIIADGDIHRFRAEGDRAGTRNAWYCMFLDGRPAGAFGSWKTGERHTWCAGGQDSLTPAERETFRRLVEAAKARRAAELADQYASAAERAERIIERSTPATEDHPYLFRKGIEAHGIRQQGDALLIPVTADGKLASVQHIYPDGNKRFMRGGRMKGGHYVIGSRVTRPNVVICEGFATGATLHQETGALIYVAFNAGNLELVTRHAMRRHPSAPCIVAAANAAWTDGNPGLTKARAAALAPGAKLLAPDFGGMDTSGKPTDWNDWYALRRAAGRVAA
jgi:putative DNA primase/helicase